MEHDTHQKKVLALGIALLVATVVIVFSMHDADANPDAGRPLRVRDAPATETTPLSSGAEGNAAASRPVSSRSTLQNRR